MLLLKCRVFASVLAAGLCWGDERESWDSCCVYPRCPQMKSALQQSCFCPGLNRTLCLKQKWSPELLQLQESHFFFSTCQLACFSCVVLLLTSNFFPLIFFSLTFNIFYLKNKWTTTEKKQFTPVHRLRESCWGSQWESSYSAGKVSEEIVMNDERFQLFFS